MIPNRRSKGPVEDVTEAPARSPVFDAVHPAEPMTKKEFRRAELELRQELLNAQAELRSADFRVLILLCGVDGAGKGEFANLLNEWLDPRGIATRAYDDAPPEVPQALIEGQTLAHLVALAAAGRAKPVDDERRMWVAS